MGKEPVRAGPKEFVKRAQRIAGAAANHGG